MSDQQENHLTLILSDDRYISPDIIYEPIALAFACMHRLMIPLTFSYKIDIHICTCSLHMFCAWWFHYPGRLL